MLAQRTARPGCVPLESMRTHEQALLLCFFAHFPPGLLASLTEARALKLRKALHRAGKRTLFAGCMHAKVQTHDLQQF